MVCLQSHPHILSQFPSYFHSSNLSKGPLLDTSLIQHLSNVPQLCHVLCYVLVHGLNLGWHSICQSLDVERLLFHAGCSRIVIRALTIKETSRWDGMILTGCTDKVWFDWTTGGRHRALHVVQLCFEKVSSSIAAIGRIRAPESKNLFEASQPLLGPDGVHTTARDHSLKVDEAIQILNYSMLEDFTDLIYNN